jgi:hypothetical protein
LFTAPDCVKWMVFTIAWTCGDTHFGIDVAHLRECQGSSSTIAQVGTWSHVGKNRPRSATHPDERAI